MNLTINQNAQASQSYVTAIDNNRPLRLPIFYFGDNLPLYIEISNGEGGVASFNGRADVILVAGIGDPKTRAVYGQTDLVWDGQKYYGELDLNTETLGNIILNKEKIQSFFEVNATYYGGNRTTILQQTLTLQNQLIQ